MRPVRFSGPAASLRVQCAAPVRRLLHIAALTCACASAPPPQPPVSRTALQGITLAIPTPDDLRPSTSTGCGQFVADLPLRIEKALVASFGDAGARFAVQAPWRLAVVVTFAGAGAEYTGPSRTPVVGQNPGLPPDSPPVLSERGGVNAGWTDTSVALDATLQREGSLVWHGTVTGHSRSAPCIDPKGQLQQSLSSAVIQLRSEVVRRIAATSR
jgi:hypothetical protein